ncbi:hypothetical protein IEQ34_016692 [Dendrobium chrysotoxum]|uniref:Ubiquitin-like protease family profile domain-containing protein n=1 Tax=Dendrobium chrysotoxum TaxID=161865 RepID=A0AAV7GGB5_DENCH|nr:hypothetical protein IEQ34_016692 [Dendrobium chrysotoxum]
MANFKIPSTIPNVADNVEEFLTYNRPASITKFLPSRADIVVQPNQTNKGTNKNVAPAGLDIVEVASEARIELWPTKLIVDYAGRSDIIYQSGDVIIYRSQIDELIKSEYLDTNHIDAFGNFLIEKSKLCPGLYEPFLFVSSLHWAYHAFKVDTTGYISHITKESVSAASLLLVPIIEQSHWTLLVGNFKIKV